MRCERLEANARTADHLRALTLGAESVREVVAEIIAEVRSHGDSVLADYTRRFDTAGADPRPLIVSPNELDAAAAALDPAVRHGIERAIENLEAATVATRTPEPVALELGPTRIVQRRTPVHRAAVYVPGGRAPYPSTVVMGVVPARLAGVEHIAVCTPPQPTGDVDPTTLAACQITGASAVYRMGGAQAIAALAYGTESIPAVDVIVGPGSLYVQEAKRQVFGQVGIDGFAGPSDLILIAAGDADAHALALDLLAQAEHGPGTLVVALSDSSALLDALEQRMAAESDTGAVASLVHTESLEQALAVAEAFAPEHLQLVGRQAEALADRVTRAGCLFVGANAGTAFGDYVAGSNHILPTNGAARFASALSPDHFTRRFSEVHISDATELAQSAAPLARAEGFELHAQSMETRISENDPR
jgi:histidinol dehydrogenase